MRFESQSGSEYRCKLPHIRAAGAIYHARFSVHPRFRWLTRSSEFESTQNAILYAHKRKHVLLAYVIMPNHAHTVLQPLPREPGWEAWCRYENFHKLEDILGDIKKFSSREINRLAGRRGSVWLKESFDRIVRGDNDLSDVIDYVHHNPVRWDLVRRPEQYPWSSASTIYSGRSEYNDWFSTSL